MPTEREFREWEAKLREKHPEMFGDRADDEFERVPARKRWHPLFLRVYGIAPWDMGRYTLREYGQLVDDLEKNGLGGGLG